MELFKKSLFLSVIILLFSFNSFSQTPPTSETAGGIIQQQDQLDKGQKLEEKIKQPKPSPEGVKIEEPVPEEEGAKVLIKKIIIQGVSLVTEEDIHQVTSQYEGKELSMKGMQKVADLITDLYRQKGYTTSRAYIPPQTITDGILTIRVVEGELGNIEIKGNHHFKTKLLRRKVMLKENEPFDYTKLQDSLAYINQNPDRTARAVLVPGQRPGTTDVIINVQDNNPFHAGFRYDNYGSKYIEEDRYSAILEHNNLLGFDDKIHLELQRSEYDLYRMRSGRYVIPFGIDTEVGIYFSRSRTKLGREFEAVDARGHVAQYGLFATKTIYDEPDLTVGLNFGFDYKDIENWLAGVLDSQDDLRIFKLGADFDFTDKWGRNILTNRLDIGVPDMFGGMDAKDANASRTGAGAKFYKGVFNYFRLQPGPFSSYFLWKNQAQYSNYNLVASEEFQIGGPVSVRGYPPAEFTGDKGYYTSLEWSFPTYGAKNIKVPFTETSLYDALHTVIFYDWATTQLNNPAGAEKKQTLKSIGFGFRLNLPNDFSARIEFGFPLGKDSSDGADSQHWIEVEHKF